jgi:predicted sugar kinase
VSQTSVTVDGATQGTQINSISFFSQNQAALSSSTGPVIYTFAGDAATSNATTSGINTISEVVVKNAVLPELVYVSPAENNVFLYAKQY